MNKDGLYDIKINKKCFYYSQYNILLNENFMKLKKIKIHYLCLLIPNNINKIEKNEYFNNCIIDNNFILSSIQVFFN